MSWEKDLACVYNYGFDCLAKGIEACHCRKMHKLEYEKAMRKLNKPDSLYEETMKDG